MSKSNTADMLRRIEMRVAELGMTKEEFYEKSGISSASYSQWNTGTHTPTKKKMAQAAAALNVSLEYILTGEEQKEKPTTVSGSELDEKSLIRAKKLSEATPDIQSLVDAILNDGSYRPKVVDKVVEVVCPLSGRVERIEQRYFVHDGKRIPDTNSGCDNCYACSECDSCRIRVMESVR